MNGDTEIQSICDPPATFTRAFPSSIPNSHNQCNIFRKVNNMSCLWHVMQTRCALKKTPLFSKSATQYMQCGQTTFNVY